MKNPFEKKTEKKSEFDIFRKQVKTNLKDLNREQTVRFVWRCAVRTLPFLAVNGNFDFWKKEVRQKHLFAIFYAIDIASAYHVAKAAYDDAFNAGKSTANDDKYIAARAAYNAADAAFASASTTALIDVTATADRTVNRADAVAKVVGIDYSTFQ